jgi:hypothetical protein
VQKKGGKLRKKKVGYLFFVDIRRLRQFFIAGKVARIFHLFHIWHLFYIWMKVPVPSLMGFLSNRIFKMRYRCSFPNNGGNFFLSKKVYSQLAIDSELFHHIVANPSQSVM